MLTATAAAPSGPHALAEPAESAHARPLRPLAPLWSDTVDELFEGERAELAKAHAKRVAQAFEARLREFERGEPVDVTSAGGLAITVTHHGAH